MYVCIFLCVLSGIFKTISFQMPKKRMVKPSPRFTPVVERQSNPFENIRNKYFHVKILFYLAICLRYPIDNYDQERGKLQKYFTIDAGFCPECFLPKSNMCVALENRFEFELGDLVEVVNTLIGVKKVHYGKLKGVEGKAVVKHTARERVLEQIKAEIGEVNSPAELDGRLYKLFLKRDRVGFYFCRQSALNMFVKGLTNYTRSRIETWMHLLVNAETILLPVMNKFSVMAVPTYYGHCGFTIYESYNGITLAEVNKRQISYYQRLQIALRLLFATSALTDGFDNYRVYLTDLTLDNVVYDEKTGNVTFIDLDSVVIVDGDYNRTAARMVEEPPDRWWAIHKYEKIPCKGCFAYTKHDLCSHYQSDINMFSVCQLLNEDLYGDQTKGFLKPIPRFIDITFPALRSKLLQCVRCQDILCDNRFYISIQLAQEIARIIKYFES